MPYRFGRFSYDPSSHRLLCEGEEVSLTHKSRELLTLFLRNPDRLLSRAEIVSTIWPTVAVTDDALRFQVAELRKALGVDGESYIRTLPREGHRWETPVRVEKPRRSAFRSNNSNKGSKTARYRLVLESREVKLDPGENVVGRDENVALSIEHPSVSRRHARIVVRGARAVLEDLGSKNGTYLRGKPVAGPTPLKDGDEIRIGPEVLVFRRILPGTTQTERRTEADRSPTR